MYRLFRYLWYLCVRIMIFALLGGVLFATHTLFGQCPPSGCRGGSCDSGGWVVVDDSSSTSNYAARNSRRAPDAPPVKVTPPNAADYAPDTPVAEQADTGDNDASGIKLPPPPDTGIATNDGENHDEKIAALSDKIKKLDALLEKIPTSDELKASAERQAESTKEIKEKISSDLKNALADIPNADALVEKFAAKLEEITASLETVRAEQSTLTQQVEETKAAASAPESNAKLKLLAVILQILFFSGLLMAVLGWLLAILWRLVRRIIATYRTGKSMVISAAEVVKEKIIDAGGK